MTLIQINFQYRLFRLIIVNVRGKMSFSASIFAIVK